jgi:large subunit ribosomal protein L21
MYAVVTTGGRQYRVSPGDTIDVEKLTGAVGDTVALTNVHLVGQGAEVAIGAPAVAGVRVEAQITAQKRGKKIIIFKHRRRKGYRRKQGHRQSLTSLKITAIYSPEQSIEHEASPEQSIEHDAFPEQSIAYDVSPEQSIEHDESPPLSGQGIA